MDKLILIPFAIGTLAFFVAVWLSIQHPELVRSTGEAEPEPGEHPLRKWDLVISWVMWGGWACAAVMTFLDRNHFLDLLRS